MTFRHGDQPTPATLDWLRQADADPPGTWIGQPKLDGHRIQVRIGRGQVVVSSKDGSPRRMPGVILDALRALDPSDVVILDGEHVGPRGGRERVRERVVLFDMLGLGGEYLPSQPCTWRLATLHDVLRVPAPGGLVELSESWANPGLVERFAAQRGVDQSEGLVIRRADSMLRLGWSRPVANPAWFKVKFR